MNLPIFMAATLLVANIASSDEPPVVVEENQTVIQVNGMVCSFCAYGAEKALSELDCLDKAEFSFVDYSSEYVPSYGLGSSS